MTRYRVRLMFCVIDVIMVLIVCLVAFIVRLPGSVVAWVMGGVVGWRLAADTQALQSMRKVVPPVDVSIATEDGATHPVQCTYCGFDGDHHTWTVIPPDWLDVHYALTHRLSIEVGYLPGNTRIDLLLESED